VHLLIHRVICSLLGWHLSSVAGDAAAAVDVVGLAGYVVAVDYSADFYYWKDLLLD